MIYNTYILNTGCLYPLEVELHGSLYTEQKRTYDLVRGLVASKLCLRSNSQMRHTSRLISQEHKEAQITSLHFFASYNMSPYPDRHSYLQASSIISKIKRARSLTRWVLHSSGSSLWAYLETYPYQMTQFLSYYRRRLGETVESKLCPSMMHEPKTNCPATWPRYLLSARFETHAPD